MDEIPESAPPVVGQFFEHEAQKKTEQVRQDDEVALEEKAQSREEAEPEPFQVTLHPVPELRWEGNWPQLAASLPVRGVVQQLAQQSELVKVDAESHAVEFHLRVPIDTLRSAGSVDKLAAALSEHFGKTIRVNTELGAVRQTANAQALADRAARQREAEQAIQKDPFVQALIREFNATIVPGSIKPI